MANVMKLGTSVSSRTAVAVAAVLALTVAPLAAQDFEPNRLSDGHPDLNGIWQALNEANYDLELHMARAAMQLREGPHGPLPAAEVLNFGAVGSVPPGMGVIKGGAKIPYTDAAMAMKMENMANWSTRDQEIFCYLPGVPRATYMPQPFQIFHSENAIFIAYQYAGAVRDIYLEDPKPAQVDSWMGMSYGRWDGDTLVVEVNGLLAKDCAERPEDMAGCGGWLDRSGNHYSNQLQVEERYTLAGPNHMHYEATLTDPMTYTEPWTIEMPLYRRMEPNARLMDFRCVEFVEELMYGEYRRNPLPRMKLVD